MNATHRLPSALARAATAAGAGIMLLALLAIAVPAASGAAGPLSASARAQTEATAPPPASGAAPAATSTATPTAAATAPPDSGAESPPAPLLTPGHAGPNDTPRRTPLERAREQVTVGKELERRFQPAAAIAAYRNAVLLDPKVPEAYYRMGKLFLTVDQTKEAVDCFTQEVAHHPANTAAGRELGLGLIALGDDARAIREFEILTRRNPSDAESWDGLAQALLGAQRAPEAETAVRRAVRLVPGRAGYVRDLGVTLAAQGRVAEARTAYHRAQTLDPKDPSAWLNLANLESRESNDEAALEAYRQAQARDTTAGLTLTSSTLAFQGQLAMLRKLGREDEAGALYRTWLRRRPDDRGARLDAVRYFIGGGRSDIALELARGAVRQDAGSGDAHLVLGIALGAAGDPRGGLDEMRRAESLFKGARDRERVNAAIAAARRGAPDSLVAFYAADSVAHPPPPPAPPAVKKGLGQ